MSEPRISGYCQHNWLDLSKPCPECEDQQPSKTPRTDKQIALTNQPQGVVALANFARQLETELSTANAEVERLKAELNWQRNRNSGHPTKGGFEFYINEEWTGLASAALDTDYGWHAALRKIRFDPDDERVRVRRVIEDDEILKQHADLLANSKALADAISLLHVQESGAEDWDQSNNALAAHNKLMEQFK